MKKQLLPAEGVDRKVNLHTHTVLSDGAFTPEEVKEIYRARGYDAVAFTDHELMIPHNDLTDETFIALNGLEVSVKEGGGTTHGGAFRPVHHLCLIARDPANTLTPVWDYDYTGGYGHMREHLDRIRTEGAFSRGFDIAGLSALTAEADRTGFLVHYNHPRWSLQTPEGYAGIEGLCGLEIYNTGCVPVGDCNPEPLLWCLRAGRNPFPIAADDMHGMQDVGGGWNMLRTERLDYASLIEALETGAGYATTGPEIHDLYMEDGKLHVSCSPAAKVRALTEGRYHFTESEEGKTVTEAVLEVPAKDARFLRVEVIDPAGRTAWSRAYARAEWAE